MPERFLHEPNVTAVYAACAVGSTSLQPRARPAAQPRGSLAAGGDLRGPEGALQGRGARVATGITRPDFCSYFAKNGA